MADAVIFYRIHRLGMHIDSVEALIYVVDATSFSNCPYIIINKAQRYALLNREMCKEVY